MIEFNEVNYDIYFMKAFSLVELLVAMGIMVILAVLGLQGINILQRNGRDTERVRAMGEITEELNKYRRDKNNYPLQSEVTFTNNRFRIANTGGTYDVALTGFLVTGTATNNQRTKYYYDAQGSSYTLCILLESGEIKSGGTDKCPNTLP